MSGTAREPTVTIDATDERRCVKVAIGGNPDAEEVSVHLSPPENDAQAGTVFVYIVADAVQFDGRASYVELDGYLYPHQLDSIISCLIRARDEAAKLGGIFPAPAKEGAA